MVEKDPSYKEDSQKPVSSAAEPAVEQQSEESEKPYSVQEQIGIVLLILVGVVIGVPFLLFMACLGIASFF